MRNTLLHIRSQGLNWVTLAAYAVFHLLPLGLFWTGVTGVQFLIGFFLYVVRGICITGGYHRYFSHRGFKTSRLIQFLIGVGGCCAIQNGPLWWAAWHRHHHKHSDDEQDIHSPIQGFFWSHIGWTLSVRHAKPPLEQVPDLVKFPELRLLDRWHWAPPSLLGVTLFMCGGLSLLFVGFLSTVCIYHSTWAVNSITHLFGKRRYATTDTSRNSLLVALITFGEGYHNNHHHCPTTAKAGFHWYEFDPTYWIIWCLSRIGIFHSLRSPSPAALKRNLLAQGAVDVGVLTRRWRRLCYRCERVVRKAKALTQDDRVKIQEFLKNARLRWATMIAEAAPREKLESFMWEVRIRVARMRHRLGSTMT